MIVARSKKKRKKKVINCSEIFERSFNSGVSGSVRECQCGKVYYDGYNDDWDWEEGELEDLKKSKNAFPVSYAVGTMRIGGEEIVLGCDCGRARKYEDFIVTHAGQIAEYLNLRAKSLAEEAERTTVNENQ